MSCNLQSPPKRAGPDSVALLAYFLAYFLAVGTSEDVGLGWEGEGLAKYQ